MPAQQSAASGAPAGRATVAPATPFARDDFDRDVWSVLGLPIDMATAPDAVQAIEIASRDRRRLSFVTPNVNFLVRALNDPEARRQILDTDLSLVDGAPLVAIGRLLGAPIAERCAGSDVFDALRVRPGLPGRRVRVFFFGGRDGAAEAASAAIDAEKRGIESAGFLNPGHGDLDSMSAPSIIEEINAAKPDFVLVALGAAKGQAWIERNQSLLTAPVVAHLGAVVDFAAGSIARAPAPIRRLGFEWAWRIKEDPALARRYWNDGLALVSIAVGRLLPAMAARSAKSTGAPAGAVATARPADTLVTLSGDLVAADRASLRDAFRRAAARGADTILDFAAVGRIDAAFLGLVLMLEKNLRAKGAAIRIANSSAAHRRILAAHAIAYNLTDLADASAAGDKIAQAV